MSFYVQVFVCSLLIIATVDQSLGDLEQSRSARSLNVLSSIKSLPIFNLFGQSEEVKEQEETPVVVPTVAQPLPIYKIHKYNGVHIQPVSSIPVVKVPVPVQTPPQQIQLPPLNQIKSLLGTTSTAETFDALRELASTKEGLQLMAGVIKSYAGDIGVDITKMSPEQVGSLISSYQYSTPVEIVPQKKFAQQVTYQVNVPKVVYEAPQPTYGPPKVIYEAPKQVYGPPKAIYETPTQVYGPPKVVYAPPQQVYGPPKITYGPPKVTYEPPKQIYVPPKVYETPQIIAPKPKYEIPTTSKPIVESGDSSSEVSEGLALPNVENSGSFKDDTFIEASTTPSSKYEANAINVAGHSFDGSEVQSEDVEKMKPIFVEDSNAGKAVQITYEAPSTLNDNTHELSQGIPNTVQEENFSDVVTQAPHSYAPPPPPKIEYYVYGQPQENQQYIFKPTASITVQGHSGNNVVPFPAFSNIPKLNEAEEVVAQSGFQPNNGYFSNEGNQVFSYSSPPVVPATSYSIGPDSKISRLGDIPLEQGVQFRYTPGQVSSYNNQISSHIFDETAAASEQQTVVVKQQPEKEKEKTTSSPNVNIKKYNRRKWMPKSKKE